MDCKREVIGQVVLDGFRLVGKTVLIRRLIIEQYQLVPQCYGPEYYRYEMMINQVIYELTICGARKSLLKDILLSNGNVVAIIEIFAINQLFSIKQALFTRIPFIRKLCPKVPIMLVGSKADLRNVVSDNLLFPFELGPFVARCFGAVKYMECSSLQNFNVREIFEEAVRCSLRDSNFEFPTEDMNDDIDSELVEKIMQEFPSEIKTKSLIPRINHLMYKLLEHDRLQLSRGLSVMLCNMLYTTCTLSYIDKCCKDPTQIFQCRLFNVVEYPENLLCSKCPANLRFFAKECRSLARFLLSIRTRDQMLVRSVIIVNCPGILNFSFLAKLTGLKYLIVVNTEVNLDSLTFPSHLHETMKHLVLNRCGITQATDVPSEIGKLFNLKLLNLANNNFKKIPPNLGSLERLHTLLIDQGNVYFPPPEVLQRSTENVINFLGAFWEDSVCTNTESKLIVVGQEGVGKSTLVKAMKRSRWLAKNKPPPKTDGVDISVLPLQDIQCRVFDLAGDVEYLNTHSLFLSSNTLHLVVYDLSRVIVDKGARSVDHLCRLELWLQTIASQQPKSNVILVGTHADHPLVNREIIVENRKLLAEVLIKHGSSHRATDPCEDCFICQPEKCPGELEYLRRSRYTLKITSSQVPHILGYFEVSSIKKYPSSFMGLRNINVEGLKSLTASSISNIMETTGTNNIPEHWLLFRESITQKLSSDEDLKQQPLMPLSRVKDIAFELEIVKKKNVLAMLRFFHSQGTYLWYEDLPEMKDIVILDPQWLSDQLRTLISHRPSVSSICDGVLHLSELSTVWAQMSGDNRWKLLTLFRSVGLCFSISDTEELFPCNLLVGWPDREIWPPVPNKRENQTSLFFEFSFVPPSFFSDLIVEVNKKKETFVRNVKPLYYRFHIVYIRKDQRLGTPLEDIDASVKGDATEDAIVDDCVPIQDPFVLHTVHYELIPHNNSLTVAVRGPRPPSIIPDIRSTIETVKRRRYPGITYSESVLCPDCVMKRVQPPALFRYDVPHDGVCSKGHKVGSIERILSGFFPGIVTSEIGQTVRVVGETLEDRFCPKLFVVLPINLECLSLKDRFVYSYMRDGYAVHLLCECPDQWHFVDSPGFRVGKPKEFFEKYGSRVCKALRFISTLFTPIKAAASLDPACKIGAAVGAVARTISKDLKSLLDSYLDKYPHFKPLLDSSRDDLRDLKSSSGLQRSELSRFLELEAKGHNFGPLVCTYVDKSDEWLWLCEEHNERFKIVK